MCLKGECTSSDLVKNDATCPFGDEIIVNKQVLALELPKVQMTCQEVFDHISTTLNELPVRYCSDPLFKSACCDFCKSNHFFQPFISECTTGGTTSIIIKD